MTHVPRNFKLLDELEDAEKGHGGADISLGLTNADDALFTDWTASIFAPPGGRGEPRFYSMQIYVGPQYPMKPPVIAFTNCINMDAVDARGVVIPEKVPYLSAWTSDKSIMGALKEIKSLILRAHKPQPPDDKTYPPISLAHL